MYRIEIIIRNFITHEADICLSPCNPALPPRPNRCQLFGPGSNTKLFEKMAASAADVINLDLEDSVAPTDKDVARKNVIEAINDGTEPPFGDAADTAVYAAARELLATGTLSDDGFKAAEKTLGYQRVVEIVGAIGHFCTTAMMANVVGVTPAADAPSHLKA